MPPRPSLFFAALLVLLVGTELPPAQGQPSAPSPESRRGIVWSPPTQSGEARSTLARIHAVGADAVRLTRLPPASVYEQADSLGLQLYVDLPVSSVPASALADSLGAAAKALDSLLVRAEAHASLWGIGLAQNVDTTVPSSCEVLSEWTGRVHQADTSLTTYYTTAFTTGADTCADAVDWVLVDVRGRTAPIERWRSWRAATRNVAIGALGTWTTPGSPAGLRVPHSPERQARYLEETLSVLLSDSPSAPSVFVYRWRDAAASPLPSRRYGLHASQDSTRPAARVVEGMYTGNQHTFAFPSGSAPSQTPWGLILLGWGLVALFGGLYARHPFVRRTVARYFGAHGFYQDAVREGRDLAPVTNSILLGAVGVALGILATCIFRGAAIRPITGHVLAAVPEGLRPPLRNAVTHPEAAGALLAGIVLWGVLFWTVVLTWVAQQHTSFSAAQGLVLVTWPCWIVLPGLPLILVATSHFPFSSVLFPVLTGGSVLALLYYTTRVLLDYRAVTGLSGMSVAPLISLSPPILFGAASILVVWSYNVPLRFLWRLVTLT